MPCTFGFGTPIQSAECGGMAAFDANVNQHGVNTSPRNLAVQLWMPKTPYQTFMLATICISCANKNPILDRAEICPSPKFKKKLPCTIIALGSGREHQIIRHIRTNFPWGNFLCLFFLHYQHQVTEVLLSFYFVLSKKTLFKNAKKISSSQEEWFSYLVLLPGWVPGVCKIGMVGSLGSD